MIRRLALCGLAALATGCDEPAPRPETAGGPSTPAAPSPAAAPPSATADPPNPQGGLTGEVSALSADRSGLNVRVTDFGTVVDLPADALFDYDKATLTPAAETELRKAAELIRRAPAGPIQVIGHTDSHGEARYNQTLSEARARTVATWFGTQVGVRQRTFQTSGKGETAPIAPNATADGRDDPQGRQKNRRVEVVLPKA